MNPGGKLPDALAPLRGLHEARLPKERSCVYFLCLGEKIQYVGQTICLELRLAQHRSVQEFDRVFFIDVPREALTAVEAAFIRTLQPPRNQTLHPQHRLISLLMRDKEVLADYWPTYEEPSDPELHRQAEAVRTGTAR